MRERIKEIINKRKEGVSGGLSTDVQKDIISMLIEDDIYKNSIEDICDEVIVMFIAGSKTVQGTTTNFLGNYTNRADWREKLHKELDVLTEKVKHDWLNAYEFEMTEDLEYLK